MLLLSMILFLALDLKIFSYFKKCFVASQLIVKSVTRFELAFV